MTSLPAHADEVPAALEPPALAPVAPGERFASIDTLRGVAVLGILAMNIIAFALPGEAYLDPMAAALEPYQGAFTGVNRAAWWVQHVVFDMKMITVFSMLFGAGLVLMDGRARERDGGAGPSGGLAGVYYRRLTVLIFIGLVHAYVIWFGDVLFMYGLCGLVLYPVRRWRPGVLIAIGLVLVAVGMALGSGFGALLAYQATAAQEVVAAGGQVGGGQEGWQEFWAGASEGMNPSAEAVREEVEAMRGPVGTVLLTNAGHALMFHLFLVPLFFVWRTVGVMLIGMALMKLGVFSGARSAGFYRGLVIVGYGVGLPLAVLSGTVLVGSKFEMITWYLYSAHINEVASVFVALGHTGAVVLVWRAGLVKWLTSRLAAVGRMALSNYLAQSLICTAIFYGWGLGHFGSMERGELMLVVLGVWVLELVWSPMWLARFRFGPAEWVWRTLTYAKAQPMRV